VKDVSPFITGTNLEIKIGLENLGNAEGKAEIEIYFESNLVEEKEVVLKEFEERNFAYHVQNIRPGKVLVKIKTEDEKTFEITIPEKQEEVIVVEEVQQEQPLIENGFEGIDLSVEDLTLPALMGGAILVILIAIVALILAK